MSPVNRERGLSPYPDPKAPYDSNPDPAWVNRLPGDLHWVPLDEVDRLYLHGRIAGACPRCGHGIGIDIPIDTPIGESAGAEELADKRFVAPKPRLVHPVNLVFDCLSTHEKDKTGCGAAVALPAEMANGLPGP